MFLSHPWQTRLVCIDSHAVLWSSIFSDIVIQYKKFDSESDSKYFFISGDHKLNINRFSDDGIMLLQK